MRKIPEASEKKVSINLPSTQRQSLFDVFKSREPEHKLEFNIQKLFSGLMDELSNGGKK